MMMKTLPVKIHVTKAEAILGGKFLSLIVRWYETGEDGKKVIKQTPKIRKESVKVSAKIKENSSHKEDSFL